MAFFCQSSFSQERKFDITSEIKNDTIKHLDLSNKKLKKLPDLSKYFIESLDISSNKIDTLDCKKLPNGLKKINISKNKIKGTVVLWKILEDINVSKNKINKLFIAGCPKKVDASKNKLIYIQIECFSKSKGVIDFVNISDNKNLSNEIAFFPWLVKTILRKNIKNKKELFHPFEAPIKD